MRIVTHEIQLSDGEILGVGMNFYALQLMTQYPGGLTRLDKDMKQLAVLDQASDEYGEMLPKAMSGLAHMLWALIRASGEVCTKEECAMRISLDDFPILHEIFTSFTERAQKMVAGKNMSGLANVLK